MALKSDPEMGINSWLEDELYRQYLRDRSTVDESWTHLFEQANGAAPANAPRPRTSRPAAQPDASILQPLGGAAGRIAKNMSASLAIPLATSQRTIAVKVMDENRRIINQHRTLVGRGKVSFTHLIGWAIVKALEEMPELNHAYAEKDGQPFRVVRPHINLGIAVDVAGQGWRAQPAGAQYQERRRAQFSGIRERVRRPGVARARRQADHRPIFRAPPSR